MKFKDKNYDGPIDPRVMALNIVEGSLYAYRALSNKDGVNKQALETNTLALAEKMRQDIGLPRTGAFDELKDSL